MKTIRILFFGSLLIGFISCSNNMEREINVMDIDTVSQIIDTISEEVEEEIEVVVIAYPFDSLMSFNSEKELIEAYGKENVSRETQWGPEGMDEYIVSVLFPKQLNQVEFFWEDAVNLSGIISISISGWNGTPTWETVDGIKIGTTMKELEELNGKPFSFYGFDWDFGGLVSWKEGNLVNKGVTVTLNTAEGCDMEEVNQMIGDVEFFSNDEIAQKVNPVVVSLTLVNQDY